MKSAYLNSGARADIPGPPLWAMEPEVAHFLQSSFSQVNTDTVIRANPPLERRPAPVRGPALFPREQPTAWPIASWTSPIRSTDIARAQTPCGAATEQHYIEKFAERNGSSVFLWLLGGAYDFSGHR